MSRTIRMKNSWNKHKTTKQDINDSMCGWLRWYHIASGVYKRPATLEQAYEQHAEWLEYRAGLDSRWNRDGSIDGWKTEFDTREFNRESRARKRFDLHRLMKDHDYVPSDERGERQKARGRWLLWD